MKEIIVKQIIDQGVPSWKVLLVKGKGTELIKQTSGRVTAMRTAYGISKQEPCRVTIQLLKDNA